MESRRDLLYISLESWYKNHPEQLGILRQLNEGKTSHLNLPSLRQIDFFVVNYAREKKTCYLTGDEKFFDVYSEYKNQLTSFTKENFDPFRRGNLIAFHGITTTICQLNFFRWAIPNGILNYVIANSQEIESEMTRKLMIRKSQNQKRMVNIPNAYTCIFRPEPTLVTFPLQKKDNIQSNRSTL